ncbi:MAG: cation:proton antiporter [Gemmatimonadales bacterium]
MPTDLVHALLVLGLFVVPVLLRRLAIPSAVTSLGLGIGAGAMGWLENDPTVSLLSTFGIVALFLSAGLHVSSAELKANAVRILAYLAVTTALVGGAAWGLISYFALPERAAWLVALAALIPSTGFILDSMSGFRLEEPERDLTRAFGVAAEFVGLGALFFVTQSISSTQLGIASLALVGLVVAVPLILKGFASWVTTHAPQTEFAFLLVLGFVCAYVTRQLGVYYLVGAFLVGVAAKRFREQLPALSSERILNGLEDFGRLFAPFYFFHAGQDIDFRGMTLPIVGVAAGLALVLLPIRIATAWGPVRARRVEASPRGAPIGVALLPTLVFALVLIDIVRERFPVDETILNVLVIYTLVATLVPGFALRAPKRAPAAAASGTGEVPLAAGATPAGGSAAVRLPDGPAEPVAGQTGSSPAQVDG